MNRCTGRWYILLYRAAPGGGGERAGLEITADHRSKIGKKLLMIGGKAGFPN